MTRLDEDHVVVEEQDTVAHRVRRAPRRESWSRAWLAGSAWYAALGAVTTVVAMGFLGMFSRPLSVPLVYDGDALSGGSQIKGTLENGWYELNPRLSAPFGQNLHDFPIADNLQFVLARVLGLFSDQWSVVYNLCYLATFPLTALAGAWFLRVVGLRRSTAFAFGLLYAFTPYHFIHSQPHLALSMLFAVPLFSGLVLKVLDDRPLFDRRPVGRWWDPRRLMTPATLGVALIVLVVGSTSSYYAVFGLLLMATAVTVSLLRRCWTAALRGSVTMIGLVLVMAANMAPDVLYSRSVAPSPAAFSRQPLESEIYALKFASLVFPAPWHRIGALSRFRLNYDGTFPNPSEGATLGLLSTIGFVFLLAMPVLSLLMRRTAPDQGPVARTQRHLALLTLVAFLFGTVGGLGTLFALFVSSDIRAWNRIVVYIALFTLTATALLVEQALRWGRRRVEGRRPALARRWSAVTLVTVTLLVVVGLYDQAAPASWTSPPDRQAVQEWDNDEAYVAQIEDVMPPGSSIFELPAMAFPESLPINDMHDYDPVRPYLHSTDLSWSYGGVKGRPRSDWQQVVTAQPTLKMLSALAASGFDGIHVDRFGYPDHDPGELETTLRALAGPPVVSPDGRFAFYDLRDFAAQQDTAYTPGQLASLRRHTLRAPVFYWEPGFTGPPVADGGHLVLVGRDAAPSALIDNPGGALAMKLTFGIRAVGADLPVAARVTWPDGTSEDVRVTKDGTEVSHQFTQPPGRTTLSVTAADSSRVDLLDLVLRDPASGFALRGRASEVAATQQDARADRRSRRGDGP